MFTFKELALTTYSHEILGSRCELELIEMHFFRECILCNYEQGWGGGEKGQKSIHRGMQLLTYKLVLKQPRNNFYCF